jgi:hypothetical protein
MPTRSLKCGYGSPTDRASRPGLVGIGEPLAVRPWPGNAQANATTNPHHRNPLPLARLPDHCLATPPGRKVLKGASDAVSEDNFMKTATALRMYVLNFYCNVTRTGIVPVPDSSGPRAFPRIAPKARVGSKAFMACPRMSEVVSMSPTRIGAVRAVA